MAKIFYVVENGEIDTSYEYTQVNFFKTEKEALKHAAAQTNSKQKPKLTFNGDKVYDEYTEAWFISDTLDFKKGFLFQVEDQNWSIVAMDEDDARKEVGGKENFGAIYFDGFKKGAWGYLGKGGQYLPNGEEYEWSAGVNGIRESSKTEYSMKHVQLFEQFINEAKKYSSSDIKKLKDFAEKVSDEILDAYDNEFHSGKMDFDDYTPEEMFNYIEDWGDGDSVKNIISDFDWTNIEQELGLR